jgi:hypothetical protein
MSQSVIYPLEMIDVAQSHREGMMIPGGTLNFVLKVFVEIAAIITAGQ